MDWGISEFPKNFYGICEIPEILARDFTKSLNIFYSSKIY